MEFHKFNKALPDFLSKGKIQLLAQSIKECGQHEKIITYEGQILDGANRYIACLIAGVEPKYEEYTGDDPEKRFFSENLCRKQMSSTDFNKVIENIKASSYLSEEEKLSFIEDIVEWNTTP